MRRHLVFLIFVAFGTSSALAEEMLQTGAAGAAAGPTTLWNFLGIPQGANKIRDATSNRFGNNPATERKPRLLQLADPKNLQSNVPAIQKAAKVKAAEDLAPQKVKALKYLARVGCGCYDKDGEVTEAFLAALDDCTEEVRFQAAINIMDAAKNHCKTCNMNCCCKEEIAKKLAKIVYERNDKGCCLEPSERVREAAHDALLACCQGGGYAMPRGYEEIPGPEAVEEIPNERGTMEEEPTAEDNVSPQKTKAAMSSFQIPGPPIPPSPNQGRPVPARPPVVPAPAKVAPTPAPAENTSAAIGAETEAVEEELEAVEPEQEAAEPTVTVESAPLAPPPHVHGMIRSISPQTHTAEIQLPTGHGLRVGHRVMVFHKYLFGTSRLGQLQVVASNDSMVTVRPIGRCQFNRISMGDKVSSVGYLPPANVVPSTPELPMPTLVVRKPVQRVTVAAEQSPAADAESDANAEVDAEAVTEEVESVATPASNHEPINVENDIWQLPLPERVPTKKTMPTTGRISQE